jgi:hypothetical protein
MERVETDSETVVGSGPPGAVLAVSPAYEVPKILQHISQNVDEELQEMSKKMLKHFKFSSHEVDYWKN